jgi:ABC-type transport system involved in multi-copper enzyme maturation permease subunit
VLLPLNCVRVCGPLIRDDLQANTLGFLSTRPLSRAGLVLGKYLSSTLWLQILLLIETLLLFGIGYVRGIDGLGRLLPLFLGSQIVAVLAWSALGAFLGLVTKRYMAIAILYGLVVELGIGRIPTNINNLSLVRHLKILLGQNPTVQDVYSWTGTGVPLAVGALVLAAIIFASLAALLFTYREYHHTTEMQK